MSKRKLQNVCIGETKRMQKFRIYDHCGYINNFIDTATGYHFTLPCHSLANLRVTVIEQIHGKEEKKKIRKKCKEYFIRKFDTVNMGMTIKY